MSFTLNEVSRLFLAARTDKKESTLSTYHWILDRYILPAFGERNVAELDHNEINGHLFCLRGEDGKLLAASTVNLTATVFSELMEFANRSDYCRFPCEMIRRTRVDNRGVTVLSASDQYKLKEYCLKKAHSNLDALVVLLNLYTGLRLGEICGLRWSDISPNGDRLLVRRTVQRVKNPAANKAINASVECIASPVPKTIVIVDRPKSPSSYRTIPIVSFISKILLEERPNNDCYVLTGSEEPMEPRKLQRRYKKISEAAGIDYKNYHTIRHSFATNCATAGMDPKSLCEILGHSDVSTTFNTYVHPSFDIKKEFLEMLK